MARRLDSGYMQAGAERLVGRLALATGEAKEAERYVHDALGRLVLQPQAGMFDALSLVVATTGAGLVTSSPV